MVALFVGWMSLLLGEACGECIATGGNMCKPTHDRHYAQCAVSPRWKRYTAEEFYRVTLINCGMTPLLAPDTSRKAST